MSREPCQLRFCPEMFSCQDPLVSCQHMLSGDTLPSSELCVLARLFLLGDPPDGQAYLLEKGLDRCWSLWMHMRSATSFSRCSPIPGLCVQQIWELHQVTVPLSSSLNPITRQSQRCGWGGCSCPKGIYVSFSWDKSSLTALQYLLQLKNSTKTFCPHRTKELSVFRCVWR